MFNHEPTIEKLQHLQTKLKLCLEFSGRTIETAGIKLSEETGEVMEAIFATSALNHEKKYKQLTTDDVVEECIDVILCALSVIMLQNATLTWNQAMDLFDKKLNKWIVKQGWIMPHGYEAIPPVSVEPNTLHPQFAAGMYTGYDVPNRQCMHTGCDIPIQTPEGTTIGTVNTATGFATINDYITHANQMSHPMQPGGFSIRSMTKKPFYQYNDQCNPSGREIGISGLINSPEFTDLHEYVETKNDELLTLVMGFPSVGNTSVLIHYTTESYQYDNDGIRYDAYAAKIFNLLNHMYSTISNLYTDYSVVHLSHDAEKQTTANLMSMCLGYTKYLDAHHRWWSLNQLIFVKNGCYTAAFREFIDTYYTSVETVEL